MKKEDQNITLLDLDTATNNDYKKDSFKTTNINILLNRVRSNKKRAFKKRIIILFFLVTVIITSTVYYTI